MLNTSKIRSTPVSSKKKTIRGQFLFEGIMQIWIVIGVFCRAKREIKVFDVHNNNNKNKLDSFRRRSFITGFLRGAMVISRVLAYPIN